jgi:uncharacterized membrane protein YbhN (UPF0104 family)
LRRRSAATLASWLLAFGILSFLVWRADREALFSALRSADLARYALATTGFVGIWLSIDAFVLSWLFGRLGAPTGWSEMVRFRGATYVFIVVSFHLANAALVGLVHRRTGVPLARVTASMLVLYIGDLTALCGVSFLASLGASSPILALIRPVLAALALGLLALFAAGLALRTRLEGRPFFGVVADLGPLDVASLVGLRAIFYGSFVLFVWVTLPTFDIALPLQAIASRMPVIMSIGALPITPGGLGTTQAAMLAFFGELADSGRVLAYALVYGMSLIVFRLPIGAALAPGVLGLLRGGPRGDA